MSTHGRNYLSDDNQIPCSSKNYGYQPLYPASNPPIATPNSPYCHSSGPPSVSMTPATPFVPQQMEPQGAVPPAYTQAWLHNYHDAPIARPQSSAQSVMSDMTVFSGISVNTHATTASYALPPGMMPPPGPLSSRSHSENIDPEKQLNTLKQMVAMIDDDTADEEIRKKRTTMLLLIPDKIEMTESNSASLSEVIINLTRSTVRALKNEQIMDIRIRLSDALYRFASKFPFLFGKMVMLDPHRPDNPLRTLLSFYSRVEPTSANLRFLRHLFPSLYTCVSTNAQKAFIQAARNTDFVWFTYSTIHQNFVNHSKNIQNYQSGMKFFARYLDMLKYFIVRDESTRLELVHKKLIDFLVTITQYHCTNLKMLSPKFIQAYHNHVTMIFKLLVTTDSKEIPDIFISSGAIEVLLTALVEFRKVNTVTHHQLIYTFTSLAYVGDRPLLQNISPKLPNNIDVFHVIQVETMKSEETRDFEMFRLISEFVVNAARYTVFQEQIIYYGHHDTLAKNFFQLCNHHDQKYIEVSDNCLFALYRLCSVEAPMFDKFCHLFFSPSFTSDFIKLFNPDNMRWIRRALNIWAVLIPKVNPETFFEVYKNCNFYVVRALLDLLKIFITNHQADARNVAMAKLSIDLLLLLTQGQSFYRHQLEHLNEINLMALLNEITNDDLSFYLLNLIHKLRLEYPDLASSCLSGDLLRDFLTKNLKSSHVRLADLCQNVLSQNYIDSDISYNNFPFL